MNFFSLVNKKILVTGATSGIGLELCKEIHHLGGSFIGVGRNTSDLLNFIKSHNISDSHAYTIDLGNENEIIDLLEGFDTIDGFVHCAGIVKNNPIQFFNRELYDQIRTVNLDSALTVMHVLSKSKKLTKGASVVFVSSISGIYGMKGNGLYGISKAALNIMAKTYAGELAGRKVRVNAVAPGMVNTRITTEAKEFLSDEVIEMDRKKYPLGYGDPLDVAMPIIFLLCDASRWITGQVITIDGGRTALL